LAVGEPVEAGRVLLPGRVERRLERLVVRLREAAGSNLKSVILYGSAVAGWFRPEHSDVNVLCVLDHLEPEDLQRLAPVVRWWHRRGYPGPLMFARRELERSARLFAIEWLDIQAHHRVLDGEDVIGTLSVPLENHAVQVEWELEQKLIALRQQAMAAGYRPRSLLRLMLEALPSVLTLLRHALLALGSPLPMAPEETLSGVATTLSCNVEAVQTLLEVRAGRRHAEDLDAREMFGAYVEVVERVARALSEWRRGEA
jgi:predicted nucleotidyltransferase